MSNDQPILGSDREFFEAKEARLLQAIEQDLTTLESKLSKITGLEAPCLQQPESTGITPHIIMNPRSSILELEEFRREKAAFLAQFNKAITQCTFSRDLIRDKCQLLSDNLRLDAENMDLKRKLLRTKQEYTSLKQIILPKRLQNQKITKLEAMMLKFAKESFNHQQKEYILDLKMRILQKDEELQKIRELHKREKEELIKQKDATKKYLMGLVGEKTPSDGVMRKLVMELIKNSGEKSNEPATGEKNNEQTPSTKLRRSERNKQAKSSTRASDSIESEDEKPRRRKRKANIDVGDTEVMEEETVQKKDAPAADAKRSLVKELSEKFEEKIPKKSATKKLVQANGSSINYFLN